MSDKVRLPLFPPKLKNDPDGKRAREAVERAMDEIFNQEDSIFNKINEEDIVQIEYKEDDE